MSTCPDYPGGHGRSAPGLAADCTDLKERTRPTLGHPPWALPAILQTMLPPPRYARPNGSYHNGPRSLAADTAADESFYLDTTDRHLPIGVAFDAVHRMPRSPTTPGRRLGPRPIVRDSGDVSSALNRAVRPPPQGARRPDAPRLRLRFQPLRCLCSRGAEGSASA